MFALEKIGLNFSGSIFFLIAGIIIISFFTYYIYKYTIPQISKSKKIILISLRSLAMVLLLLLIFEPILTVKNKTIEKPIDLVFVDNSRSMNLDDERNKTIEILNGLDNLDNVKFFTFGSSVKTMSPDSLENIKYTESSTNFENIFKKIKNIESNISSLTIVSDGNITDGLSPANNTEELSFPVFTFGLGDTTENKDVSIKKVNYNKFIYTNTPTTISAVIKNYKLSGSSSLVSLFEENKLIEQKKVILTKDGINNVSFSYKPNQYGERKLKIVIAPLQGEKNKNNNKKIFYINVQKSKLKILIIAGSPSNDLSIIKESLKENKNLSVNSLTQITNNRFLEKNNPDKLLDSADVFFLIGFPSAVTNISFINKVKSEITKDKKPYFFLLSNSFDFSKAKYLNDILSFNIKSTSERINEVLVSIKSEERSNPILQTSKGEILEQWNNLPPVFQPATDYQVKPGSSVLSEVMINNIPINKPLIITRKLAGYKSITIFASGIWRWKLLASANGTNIFDNFISNSIKWLNASDTEKKVIIKPVKKLYSLHEDVEFTAQVYDESFNPVSNADVSLSVTNKKNNSTAKINLTSKGNGLYDGVFQSASAGDYSYSGKALLSDKLLGKDSGKFNIGETDVELLNTKLNSELLKNLSNNTNGKYFSFAEKDKLINLLKRRSKNNIKEKIITGEFSLWSNKWFLITIVLLFSIEWFIRRRLNMM